MLRGEILFAKSPDDTLAFYRDFLEKSPDANELRLTMARLLVNQKRFDEARLEFMRLVEASTGTPEVLRVVALLSLQAGNRSEEGRVGKDFVSQCSYRWAPNHKNKQ